MTSSPLSIEGHHIVLTGATSGIGRQCAIDFAKAGARLVLLGRNSANLDQVLSECTTLGAKCLAYTADVTDAQAVKSAIEDAVGKAGKIDGLLYAAGIEKTLPFNKLTADDYQDIYAVNVVGAMNLVALLSKKANRGDNPHYVLISSITGIIGRPGVAAYAASKGALLSAVKTIALELAQKNATINCISPGTIMTPLMVKMMESLSEEQREARKAGFPLGLGEPADISATAQFLLSSGSRWITGQNIVVDGGYTAR